LYSFDLILGARKREELLYTQFNAKSHADSKISSFNAFSDQNNLVYHKNNLNPDYSHPTVQRFYGRNKAEKLRMKQSPLKKRYKVPYCPSTPQNFKLRSRPQTASSKMTYRKYKSLKEQNFPMPMIDTYFENQGENEFKPKITKKEEFRFNRVQEKPKNLEKLMKERALRDSRMLKMRKLKGTNYKFFVPLIEHRKRDIRGSYENSSFIQKETSMRSKKSRKAFKRGTLISEKKDASQKRWRWRTKERRKRAKENNAYNIPVVFNARKMKKRLSLISNNKK
jgi:hypothetical protein